MRFVQLSTEKHTLLLDYDINESSEGRSSDTDHVSSETDEITITPCKMKPISQIYRRMEEHNEFLLHEI